MFTSSVFDVYHKYNYGFIIGLARIARMTINTDPQEFTN